LLLKLVIFLLQLVIFLLELCMVSLYLCLQSSLVLLVIRISVRSPLCMHCRMSSLISLTLSVCSSLCCRLI